MDKGIEGGFCIVTGFRNGRKLIFTENLIGMMF
jgi:hypothetical protein